MYVCDNNLTEMQNVVAGRSKKEEFFCAILLKY
jgi:hypothetical protein